MRERERWWCGWVVCEMIGERRVGRGRAHQIRGILTQGLGLGQCSVVGWVEGDERGREGRGRREGPGGERTKLAAPCTSGLGA